MHYYNNLFLRDKHDLMLDASREKKSSRNSVVEQASYFQNIMEIACFDVKCPADRTHKQNEGSKVSSIQHFRNMLRELPINVNIIDGSGTNLSQKCSLKARYYIRFYDDQWENDVLISGSSLMCSCEIWIRVLYDRDIESFSYFCNGRSVHETIDNAGRMFLNRDERKNNVLDDNFLFVDRNDPHVGGLYKYCNGLIRCKYSNAPSPIVDQKTVDNCGSNCFLNSVDLVHDCYGNEKESKMTINATVIDEFDLFV